MMESTVTNKLQSFSVKNGEQKRADCPFCNGKNTFSITRQGGKLLYYCFRSSCMIRGILPVGHTKEDIKALFNKKPEPEEINGKFIMPKEWQYMTVNTLGYDLLQKYHCTTGMWRNQFACRYDPRQNRLVFLIENLEGEFVGGIGRSLKNEQPKWYKYGKSDFPFWPCQSFHYDINIKRQCIIVEDPFSAGVCCTVTDSIAVLGTNITKETILLLKKYYDLVWIAFDPDARKKAHEVRDKIKPYINTKVLAIDKELKYYNMFELRNYLRKIL